LTALAVAACSEATEPTSALAGAWRTVPVPSGSGIDLTLGASGAIVTGTGDNNQTPPAGEPGQTTYVFRSLEDPTVPSRPRDCPFNQANLFLGATIWSIDTRAVDSRVANEAVQQFGIASACGLITAPLVPSTLVPFYLEFTIEQGPDRGDSYTAVGNCQVITNNVPRPGIILAGCALRVIAGPPGTTGGAATSMSIFNPLRLEGAGTGSFWTVRVYTAEE
jgi:hypothetical protein